MAGTSKGRITLLLKAWKEDGDFAARDELFSLIEDELHAIARQSLRRMGNFQRKLQPTEIVSELYLKLADYDVTWENRHFFFSMVGRIVRNILLDVARREDAAKRPPSVMRLAEEAAESVGRRDSEYEVLEFYHVLDRLRTVNPRHAETVEWHGILGLTLAEVAEHHGISPVTAKRDLKAAKAWLLVQMGRSVAG